MVSFVTCFAAGLLAVTSAAFFGTAALAQSSVKIGDALRAPARMPAEPR